MVFKMAENRQKVKAREWYRSTFPASRLLYSELGVICNSCFLDNSTTITVPNHI